MADNQDKFYEKLTEAISFREKQKNSFVEDVVNLREKCTQMMISFHDLVHPKKWVILEEKKKKFEEEIECLKHTTQESLDDKFVSTHVEKIPQEFLNGINEALKESDEFLRNYQNELN